MRLVKKIVSCILVLSILFSVMCVGTVNSYAARGSYSVTLDADKDGYFLKFVADKYTDVAKSYNKRTMPLFGLYFYCKEYTYFLDVCLLPTITQYSLERKPANSSKDFRSFLGIEEDTSSPNSSLTIVFRPAKHERESLEYDEFLEDMKTCSKIKFKYDVFLDDFIYDELQINLRCTSAARNYTRVKDISSLKMSDISDCVYTGEEIEPKSLKIKDGDKTLKKGTDYTVTYENNKDIGKATAIIEGKGNYSGSKKVYFKIVPKKTALKVTKKTNSRIKLTWNEVDNADGYVIYCSTNGGKYKKIKTVYSGKRTITLKNFDYKNNTYKFKIKVFTEVDSERYYSAFSKVKKVS